MQRALDLARAVATHLDAVGTASGQAGSPLGRSTYCFKYTSFPRRLGSEACLAHSYKGASPLVESPRRGHTPFGTPKRGNPPPRGSVRPSRLASRRFHHEPPMNNVG